jgi:AraC family transcriptional regulator, regulatory protein of adaptative response / DNA-3-methyladenine glycosylase II
MPTSAEVVFPFLPFFASFVSFVLECLPLSPAPLRVLRVLRGKIPVRTRLSRLLPASASENGQTAAGCVRYNEGMELDANSCYQAMLARDARFDGRFFVGVATTRIYCRPVCTVRTPRRESCSFYPSPSAAERAGFRPCLRCRPELAPGSAPIDAAGRLAAAVAGRIEDGALADRRVEELAAEIGISDRHLRRVLRSQFGVTPVELAQTQRLLLAKRLLTDTVLSVTDVAFASGFSSLRRFNALFRERYRLNPTDLRKARTTAVSPETLVCELTYRPPLDWMALLEFLAGRASRGVETRDGSRYLRTVAFGGHRGWIAVEPAPAAAALRVALSASLLPVLLPTLARVKRLFDLAAEPAQIAAHLGALAAARPGLRVPGAFDGFEVAVRAVLGQQVSVAAATTLASRFTAAFGDPVETPHPSLTHLPATAARVAELEPAAVAAVGIPVARARTIVSLAGAVARGEIALEPGADIDATMARLQALPGIGEWTAQYLAMRALAWPDAFPHADLGIRKAIGEKDPRQVLRVAEAWQPWRAYAAMHLWKSLENKP